jgi:hypothetical protein
VTIDGSMMQQQALKFAVMLQHPEFKASQGWLDCFKKRQNLSWKSIVGEAGLTIITNRDACEHIQALRLYLTQQQSDTSAVMRKLNDLSDFVDERKSQTAKQTSISCFFLEKNVVFILFFFFLYNNSVNKQLGNFIFFVTL